MSRPLEVKYITFMNAAARQAYAFVRCNEKQASALSLAVSAGAVFSPEAYDVLVTGEGEPSAAVKAFMRERFNFNENA